MTTAVNNGFHGNGLPYETIDDLVEKREEAIASLDLPMFARHLEDHRIHFITPTHYSTGELVRGFLEFPNPNYDPFTNDLASFVADEKNNPLCLGFVPLTKEAEAELKKLGLTPKIRGDILTSQKEIYDAYK